MAHKKDFYKLLNNKTFNLSYCIKQNKTKPKKKYGFKRVCNEVFYTTTYAKNPDSGKAVLESTDFRNYGFLTVNDGTSKQAWPRRLYICLNPIIM